MPSPPQRTILSVSELNAEIDLLLKEALPLLWIEGEISNLARPTSGHLYFSLKDNKATVRCAMFRNRCLRASCQAENGLKVQLQVHAGIYQPRGDYQLIVEKMEKAGAGALQQAFETLKQQLAQQGLFAQEHKKKLPRFPKRIGIITSPTGAALQDIIHVLKRRCPHIPLLIYPVAVQGEQAVPTIVNALQQANAKAMPTSQQCDVLILARGGGSIEDLWAFNDLSVAHAIYDSHIPIVTGIGHEIDFTIADFVSDQRAPTPSAAAEMVSPNKETLQDTLQTLKQRLYAQSQKTLSTHQEQINRLKHALAQHHPKNRLTQQTQQLDELEIRLHHAFKHQWSTHHFRLQTLQQRLLTQSPQATIDQQQKQLQLLKFHLQSTMQQKLDYHQQLLRTFSAKLHAISPLATLQRGYAIAQTQDSDAIIRSIQQVENNDTISIRLTDGKLHCTINHISKSKP